MSAILQILFVASEQEKDQCPLDVLQKKSTEKLRKRLEIKRLLTRTSCPHIEGANDFPRRVSKAFGSSFLGSSFMFLMSYYCQWKESPSDEVERRSIL